MRVKVTHGIDDLYADLRKIAVESRADMREVIADGIRAGNEVAKGYARAANPPGSHSRKYPRTFSAEMHRGTGLFGNVYSGEYGPRHAGQGMLAGILENGSASGNRAQMNLARSSDMIFAQFPREVRALPDRWFWPGS